MTDRYLYVLALPSDAQTLTQSQLRQQLSKLGAISGGNSAVESISVDPGEQILRGQYRGQYAAKMATEIEELFDNNEMGPVVYRGTGSDTPEAGYYALENVTVGRADPREDRLQDFDGRLTKEGTRASQWRATATTRASVNNDFGNNTTAYIGIPATASKIRWYNPETEAKEQPSLVETRNAEHGDVEIYDADASSYSDPTAIYELPYANEGEVDVRVYDDRGNGLSNKTDANNVLQWQKVFAPPHAFGSNLAIVDTGLLRLAFDENNQSLSAEQWDDANTTWSSVSLGSSDWQLFDLDIRRITAATVEARVEFENPTTSPNSYYTLTMLAHRGYSQAQWLYPDGKGPVPNGLVTKLDPIANEQTVDPQPEKGLVPRDEVQA